MGFQQSVYWPGNRTEFPTGKVGNYVFRTVRHQQTHRITLPDAVMDQQAGRPVYRRIKFRIRKTTAVCFRKKEVLNGRGADAVFEQMSQVQGTVSRRFGCHRYCLDIGAQPRTRPGSALAPASPMFIETGCDPRTALQRSAMFPAMVRNTCISFAPLERGAVLWILACFKYFVPTGRGTQLDLAKKKTRSWTFVV